MWDKERNYRSRILSFLAIMCLYIPLLLITRKLLFEVETTGWGCAVYIFLFLLPFSTACLIEKGICCWRWKQWYAYPAGMLVFLALIGFGVRYPVPRSLYETVMVLLFAGYGIYCFFGPEQNLYDSGIVFPAVLANGILLAVMFVQWKQGVDAAGARSVIEKSCSFLFAAGVLFTVVMNQGYIEYIQQRNSGRWKEQLQNIKRFNIVLIGGILLAVLVMLSAVMLIESLVRNGSAHFSDPPLQTPSTQTIQGDQSVQPKPSQSFPASTAKEPLPSKPQEETPSADGYEKLAATQQKEAVRKNHFWQKIKRFFNKYKWKDWVIHTLLLAAAALIYFLLRRRLPRFLRKTAGMMRKFFLRVFQWMNQKMQELIRGNPKKKKMFGYTDEIDFVHLQEESNANRKKITGWRKARLRRSAPAGEQVRALYQFVLLRLRYRGIPDSAADTTRNILQQYQPLQQQSEPLESLTALYERVRYGEQQPDKHALQEAYASYRRFISQEKQQ